MTRPRANGVPSRLCVLLPSEVVSESNSEPAPGSQITAQVSIASVWYRGGRQCADSGPDPERLGNDFVGDVDYVAPYEPAAIRSPVGDVPVERQIRIDQESFELGLHQRVVAISVVSLVVPNSLYARADRRAVPRLDSAIPRRGQAPRCCVLERQSGPVERRLRLVNVGFELRESFVEIELEYLGSDVVKVERERVTIVQ